MTTPRYRPLALGGSLEADLARRPDGATVVVSREPLAPYPERLTDRLVEWATRDPDRILVAKRIGGGDWRRVSYGEALRSARAIAQALLDRGLSPERPVAILSDSMSTMSSRSPYVRSLLSTRESLSMSGCPM